MSTSKTESSALLETPPAGTSAAPSMFQVLCTQAIVTNMLLLGLLQALDKSDMKSTIAGMLRAMEQDFGINADMEAVLLLVSALPTALVAPFWGLLADSYPRFRLMVLASIMWSLFTFLSAAAPSFWVLCIARGFTAAALGAILPISQGIVVDLVPAVYRGRMFALLTVCGGGGAGVALLLATNFSSSYVGHMRGWRWLLIGVAVLSLLSAAFIRAFAVEPRRLGRVPPLSCETANETMRYMANVPTFILLVVQGIFGLVPWSALSGFMPLWLQYSGLHGGQVSLALLFFGLGNGLGELIGGVLGDVMAGYFPDTGRTRVAQASVVSGMFFTILIFVVIPDANEGFSQIVPLLFCLGLTGTWCGSGVKVPMLAEIVPSNMIVSVMGMAYGLEHASSAIFGSLASGVLAQHVFGYEASADELEFMPAELKQKNAQALRASMAWMMLVPWLICIALWVCISWTYPNDRDRVLADEKRRMLREAEQTKADLEVKAGLPPAVETPDSSWLSRSARAVLGTPEKGPS